MTRFRKKPVEVEARQWDGTLEVAGLIVRWILDEGGRAHYETVQMQDGHIVIQTLEDGPDWIAKHVASPGDWIIQGIQGEFYPCKPDIFEATYEYEAETA